MLKKISKHDLNPVGSLTCGPGDLVQPLFSNDIGLVISHSHTDLSGIEWFDVLIPNPPVERFRITSSGGLGIGTRAPSVPLTAPLRYNT